MSSGVGDEKLFLHSFRFNPWGPVLQTKARLTREKAYDAY